MTDFVLMVACAVLLPLLFGVLLFHPSNNRRKRYRVLYVLFLAALSVYGAWQAVQVWQQI